MKRNSGTHLVCLDLGCHLLASLPAPAGDMIIVSWVFGNVCNQDDLTRSLYCFLNALQNITTASIPTQTTIIVNLSQIWFSLLCENVRHSTGDEPPARSGFTRFSRKF